jgi:hypothetical protein
MKKYNIDHEKLSAYLDGELPLSEKNELEQRLSVSSELREKLEELKKLKEFTSSSYRKLPESPFLETRVMANLKTGQKESFLKRRWIPVLGLVAVTIILMLVFKYNPNLINRIVEEQTTNIAAFYKANLKPLLYAANLSNEDIFNFAFYNELPLDNKNEQFLQIGQDSSGREFFEIKKTSYNVQENNYERFVAALNLNDNQKQDVDSILQHYASELQAQVLVNDRNTVAINPNLWNYNKAIAADIVKFAAQVNEPGLRKIIPVSTGYFTPKTVNDMVVNVKSKNDNDYIFLTPDTIFTSWVDVDSREMKEELRKVREEMKRASREIGRELAEKQRELRDIHISIKLDSLRHNKFKRQQNKFDVYVGDNNFRIEMKEFQVPEIPDMDSISALVDKVMRSVQVYTTNSPKSPSRLSKRYNFQYKSNDSLPGVGVNSGIDSMVNMNFNYFQNQNKLVDSILTRFMPDFRMKSDSLTTYFKMYDDSSRYQFETELQNQLQEMELELKRFREEMRELRKDLQKDTSKSREVRVIRKPVEI